MLEKVPGCRRPEKLRAILLMEADFNFANKLFFGYRMMHRAEYIGVIPREIEGSRKAHQAIDVALNRCLIWDVFWLKRISGILTSVDAATCYDRMAHAIISLCTRRLGMPQAAINSLLSMIQQMRFYLRTAFGDSDTFYGGSLDDPLQGCCQGNGGGLAMWLSITIPLVEHLYEEQQVAVLHTVISKKKITFVGDLYVDDTDLVTVAVSRQEPFLMVLSRAQDKARTWQTDLRVTGGDLKWDKSSWCSVEFEWDTDGQWRYKAPSLAHKIYIKDSDNETIEMKWVGPADPVKALGVIQAADGSMKGQMEHLLGKIDAFAEGFKEMWVPRRYAWLGFWQMMLPSLNYPFAACSFTPSEAETLMKALRKLTISKLGVAKSFPKAYFHAPPCFQGLHFPDIEVEQGIQKMAKLLIHGTTGSQTSDLLLLE